MSYGGIEAGGTTWVCAVGEGDGRLLEIAVLRTSTPAETITAATQFFVDRGPLSALGIGTFGPVDLRAFSPTFGHLTTTPKPGWPNADLVSPLQTELGVPVAIDTDVNCAALGEWRYGAGRGADSVAYVTIGTGVGGGLVIGGQPWHGGMHPELGHIRIPHDRARDPFSGSCPFHGDCLEGLASGQALRERWGHPAEELTDPRVWELEAEYIALGLVNLILTLTPERIVLGGGVAKRSGLLGRVRQEVGDLLAAYIGYLALPPDSGLGEYIVEPKLGECSGVHGALELARRLDDGPGHAHIPKR